MNFDKQPNFQHRAHPTPPHRKQPSVMARRLRAKLRALGQPAFILSAVTFSLMGFFLWRTVFPPNQASLFQQVADPDQNQLDPDSQAAGVDLDSLQVLLSDINNPNNAPNLPPVNLLNPQQLNQTQPQKSSQSNSLLQQPPGSTLSLFQSGNAPRSGQPTSNYPLLNYNPALSSTNPINTSTSLPTRFSLPRIGTLNPAVTSSPAPYVYPGLTQQTMIGGNQANTTLPANPLQAAMNRYNATQTQQPGSTTQANQAVPTGQFFPPNYNQSYFGTPGTYFPSSSPSPQTAPTTPGINYQALPTTTNSATTPYNSTGVSTLRRSSVPYGQPTTSGTTSGLVPPAMPTAPVNSLRQPNVYNSGYGYSTQPSYGQTNPSGATQNTPTVQNAPVPNSPYSVPGTIGNGYINTFSNPAGPPLK